eukprot:13042438-Alexandrium_andersonii.AAC.1
MRCLTEFLQRPLDSQPEFSFGFRKGYQVAETVQILRSLVEKSVEWGTGLVVAKLDMRKAYDSVAQP